MNDKLKNRIRIVMEDFKIDKVFVTSDDQIFIAENLALNHAVRDNGAIRKEKLKLTEITAADIDGKKETESDKAVKLVESLTKAVEITKAEIEKKPEDKDLQTRLEEEKKLLEKAEIKLEKLLK